MNRKRVRDGIRHVTSEESNIFSELALMMLTQSSFADKRKRSWSS